VPVIPHEVCRTSSRTSGIYTGENMGISTNSKGQIYIYHRAYDAALRHCRRARSSARSGASRLCVRSLGPRDAQDNIWAVDEGTDMLVRFSPEGKVHDDRPARRSVNTLEHAGRCTFPDGTRSNGSPPDGCRVISRATFVSDGY
jgi:hypothetical protein